MSKNTNLSFLTDYITADITNGRIGINNASPTVAFDVSGATKISGALTLTSTISNGTYTYTLPSATGILALTSALSGTTNYVPKFTASGTIGNSSLQDDGTNVSLSNGYYISTRTDNTSVLRTHLLMQRGSGAGTYADIFTAGDTTNGVASIHFGFNSSSKMVITAAGNVGIGTSTPTNSTLEVRANADNISWGSVATLYGYLTWGTSASFGENVVIMKTPASTGIVFQPAGTERMRINSGGGVIINAPVAATGMYVNGKDNYWVSEMKAGSTNNQSFGLKIMASTNTSDTAISINNAADNLNLLKIRGGDGYTQIYGVYNNTAGSSANVFVSSDGGVQRSTASSLRYKENINEWSGNGLSTILALNPKTFTYKSNYYSNPERQFLGLIAEEVAEVSSYLADYENEDKTGQVENVRYANIVVPLIAAIKEQQSQIEELKTLLKV